MRVGQMQLRIVSVVVEQGVGVDVSGINKE